jgi:hypothetical protein
MARPPKPRRSAFAYLRTSSAANVGADKDSDKRQRQAIETFAKHAGYELIEEFYDAAVSGADGSMHCGCHPGCCVGPDLGDCGDLVAIVLRSLLPRNQCTQPGSDQACCSA